MIPRVAIGSNPLDLELHLFTDASQDAYSAVVYARAQFSNHVKVELLLAKSRLAPLSKGKGKTNEEPQEAVKSGTIPRLELMRCFIGARLLQNVKEFLKCEQIPYTCWSDSTTALAWIKRDENWGTFVGNRVREINRLTTREQWRHVPGNLNPADLPSRGCTPFELRESRWWEGPTWLYGNKNEWPAINSKVYEKLVDQERRKSNTDTVANVTIQAQLPLRFGSYWKNVRTAGYVRRFINHCLDKPEVRMKSSHLSQEELRQGEIDLIRGIQMRHFPGNKVDKNIQVSLKEDGLMHVTTRLTYRKDCPLFKSPILLPSLDQLVHQLIEFVHLIYCHAGAQFVLNKLRERYWILQGRRTVNKVIRKCVTCRRFSAKSFDVNPAPLPIQRIETVFAFQTTGVDLALYTH